MPSNDPGSRSLFHNTDVEKLFNNPESEIPLDFDFEMPDKNSDLGIPVNSGLQTPADAGLGALVDIPGSKIPVNPAAANLYGNPPSLSSSPAPQLQSTELLAPPPGSSVPMGLQLNQPILGPLPGCEHPSDEQRAEQVLLGARENLSSPKKFMVNAHGVYGYLLTNIPEVIEFIQHHERYVSTIVDVGVQFQITSAWCEARQIIPGPTLSVSRSVLLKSGIVDYLKGTGREGFGFMNTPVRELAIAIWYWSTDETEVDGLVWPTAFGDLVLRWQRPRHIGFMMKQRDYIQSRRIL